MKTCKPPVSSIRSQAEKLASELGQGQPQSNPSYILRLAPFNADNYFELEMERVCMPTQLGSTNVSPLMKRSIQWSCLYGVLRRVF